MHSPSLTMAALQAYTALGWHLFPVAPLERNPITKRGCNDAANDLGALRKRSRRTPDANIGVHCGKSGICAVDIDPRNGGEASIVGLAAKGTTFSGNPAGGNGLWRLSPRLSGARCRQELGFETRCRHRYTGRKWLHPAVAEPGKT